MILWQCYAAGEKKKKSNTEHNGRQCPHFLSTSNLRSIINQRLCHINVKQKHECNATICKFITDEMRDLEQVDCDTR